MSELWILSVNSGLQRGWNIMKKVWRELKTDIEDDFLTLKLSLPPDIIVPRKKCSNNLKNSNNDMKNVVFFFTGQLYIYSYCIFYYIYLLYIFTHYFMTVEKMDFYSEECIDWYVVGKQRMLKIYF